MLLFFTPPSLSHPGVAYSLEADADLRKKGLKPRATLRDGSENNPDGTITIAGQGQKQCFKRQLAIQVATL